MQIETAVFKLSGHSVAGPTGLLDQSKARMRAPISPPPLRKRNSGDWGGSDSFVGVELTAGSSSKPNQGAKSAGGFEWMKH
jgi:hypothetical protein